MTLTLSYQLEVIQSAYLSASITRFKGNSLQLLSFIVGDNFGKKSTFLSYKDRGNQVHTYYLH